MFNECDTQDHKDENELYIICITFEVENTVQNLDPSLYRESN